MHEDELPLSRWRSSFRYIRIEIPRAEFEMSIASLDSPDALLRLKEATGALGRFEQSEVANTPERLSGDSVTLVSKNGVGEVLETLNRSVDYGLESVVEQSNCYHLAVRVMLSQPKVPREALYRLELLVAATYEDLRHVFLQKAREGMFE